MGLLYFVLIMSLCVLIAEALRESKREMTNATRGIYIYCYYFQKLTFNYIEESSSSIIIAVSVFSIFVDCYGS